MRLPQEYVERVCGFGKGSEACRFLAMSDGFMCLKATPTATTINARVEANDFGARGDNCPGISPNACQEGMLICTNASAEGCCQVCSGGDMANCKFDPEVGNQHDCRSRCTNPDGPCPEGQTFYEKLGYQFVTA